MYKLGQKGIAIEQLLIKLKQKIAEMVKSHQYEELCKNHKQISQEFKYFLNATSKFEFRYHIEDILSECVKMIAILIKSTQFSKFGHSLPFFASIVNQFQKTQQTKIVVSEEKVMQRIQKNQESECYTTNMCREISSKELRILKNGRIHYYMNLLMQNQIFLQDPSCVCCSQVFIKDYQVYNSNQQFSIIVDYGTNKILDSTTLEKHINAVLNEGGGVILIGADKQDGVVTIRGKRFRNNEQIAEKEQEILEAISNVRPKIYNFHIERVLVYSSYLDDNYLVQQEYRRICFRVKIFPNKPYEMTFLEYSAKGLQKIHEIYVLDLNDHPVRIQNYSYDGFYQFCHQKYKQRTQRVSSHPYIECFRPHENYSAAFNSYISEKESQKDLNFIQSEAEPSYFSLQDEPRFKYNHATLLAVSSTKESRYIKDFVAAMKKGKYPFEINVPFAEQFKQDMRPIYLLSHQMNFIELKNLIKMFEKNGYIKSNQITIMPVFSTLEVETQKYSEEVKKNLHKRFRQRYNEPYEVILKQSVKRVYLKFNDLSQAIFAYMIFQQMSIRPYFVRSAESAQKVFLEFGYTP